MKVNSLENLTEWLLSDTKKFYQSLITAMELTMSNKEWSVSDLAEAMDRSEDTVRRLLSGKVASRMQLSTFIRLLHALDFDIPLERLDEE